MNSNRPVVIHQVSQITKNWCKFFALLARFNPHKNVRLSGHSHDPIQKPSWFYAWEKNVCITFTVLCALSFY